jgi:hypothetical protein
MWCGVFTDDGDQFRWNAEDTPLARLTQPGLVCGPRFLLAGEMADALALPDRASPLLGGPHN